MASAIARAVARGETSASAVIEAPLARIMAQAFRRWYRDRVSALFQDIDAILAPETPCMAPLIGQQSFVLAELPVRPNLGLYTQPISFIGLPVVAVPVALDPLPIGVEIIAAP
jgi:Asp-tRNA(Asn)/Glu-tRNA(Gln) amidotransferase A subunit family amidase